MFEIDLPLMAMSPNKTSGEHWSARAKRARIAHEAVALLFHGRKPVLPCVVTLTRVAPSKRGLDQHDNLRQSLKPTADAVAAWLGVDDADERVEWRYGHATGPYAVRAKVEARGPQ